MTRSPRSPSDRHREFMDAAEALFNEQGYENTTVDDIVKRVGVAKGLFYYYFRSREELLAQIVNRLLDEMESSMIRATSAPWLSARERLFHMFDSGREVRARSTRIMMYFHQERNQALHWQFEERAVKAFVPTLVSIIEQGNEEGIFHSPYPQETALALFAANGVVSRDNTDDGHVMDIEATSKVLASLSERLLVAEEGSLEPLVRQMLSMKAPENDGHTA